MSNRNEVAIIYKQVIEDVLRKVRRDFVNMGVDEQVLQELQSGWEQKLMGSGIFDVKPPPPPISTHSIPTQAIVGGGEIGGPTPLVAIPPLLSGGQPTYPQMGYAVPGSAVSAFAPQHHPPISTPTIIATTPTAPPNIMNITGGGGATPSQRQKRHIDSDPDALGSDLDSTDSEHDYIIQNPIAPPTSGGGDSTQEEQPDPKENFLLCLYEKVHRTRNKWRCTFQNGILHVDGQEFILGKINGEFEW